MTSPRLIFAYMDVGEGRKQDTETLIPQGSSSIGNTYRIPLNQKIPYENKSLRDDVHGRTNAA
jgi:hypothetical protein